MEAAQGGPSFWTTPDEKAKAMRWLLGLGGTWIILTLMVDLGDTADLAVALALVVSGSVILAYGPDVFKSLGVSTAAKGAARGYEDIPHIPAAGGALNEWAPVSGARISQGVR